MEEQNSTGRIPFFRSVRGQYVVAYLVIIVAILALLNTYPVLATQNLVMQQSKKSALQSQTAVMASALVELESLTADQVSRVLTVLGNVGLDRVLVTDPTGLVLYDSAAKKGDGEEQPPRYALFQEVSAALMGQDVFRSEFRDGVILSSAAEPLVYRNVVIGAIYIYETDAAGGALLHSIQSNLRTISLIIGALAFALSLIFSRALTARLNALLRAIRIVREGEYSHRVSIKGRDEMHLLAEEFNQLTGRLQTTEEARRRFVSDASHELKTPLASIRLLTDSILQSEHMDGETTKDFVSDIGAEAERLTRITEDLLTLTRMDGEAPKHHMEAVAVGQVAARVKKMLSPLAQAVQVELTVACEPDCVVNATEDGLYKIIYNLAENAVKYNLPGGTVEITARFTDGDGLVCDTDTATHVALRVTDSGVGIPEEELSKIFDRFYRVDKARSRAAGGTGLGLAIVQDTAKQYRGWVSVQRRKDCQGTVFTVMFPRHREGGEAQ